MSVIGLAGLPLPTRTRVGTAPEGIYRVPASSMCGGQVRAFRELDAFPFDCDWRLHMKTDPIATLRARLCLESPVSVGFRRGDVVKFEGFDRERIEYQGREGDPIPAFLFVPSDRRALGGVVVFHQHNGEFHFGKSEVAGEVGDAFQAFGPALARRGLAVLAPDAITFEDRRGSVRGVEPDHYDWLQHYNAMSYRLLDGDLLMRKCLDDAQRALSVLLEATGIDESKVGVAGHSYGGYTAMYHAALDARCRFACISGAVCSFERRRDEGTGITMFEIVPGLARSIDTHDVLSAIGPRSTMVVSGSGDKYSRDADRVVAKVAGDFITELRVDRGHALDRERFDAIVDWIVDRVSAPREATPKNSSMDASRE